MKTKLGQIVMTRGIFDEVGNNPDFAIFVLDCLEKYEWFQDWGDLCEEDKEANNLAIKTGDDRILARYNNEYGDIYIITEWDQSVTTILFCNEY